MAEQTERDMLVELKTLLVGVQENVAGIRSDIAVLYSARNDHDRRTTTLEGQVASQDRAIARMRSDMDKQADKASAHSKWITATFIAPLVIALIVYLITKQTPVV